MKKWKIFFIGIIFMFGVGGCKSGAQNSPVGDNENKHICACDLWGHHLAAYFSCLHEIKENRKITMSVNLYKP